MIATEDLAAAHPDEWHCTRLVDFTDAAGTARTFIRALRIAGSFLE